MATGSFAYHQHIVQIFIFTYSCLDEPMNCQTENCFLLIGVQTSPKYRNYLNFYINYILNVYLKLHYILLIQLITFWMVLYLKTLLNFMDSKVLFV